jgi:hypothetical protein
MKKDKLVNFISKYSLNGLCNQVKVTSKDNKLLTSFATDQKDLLGFVMVDGVDIKSTRDTTLGSDFEFGIFNTGIMTKILSVMQSDVDVTFTEEFGKIVSVELKDSVMTSQVMLADLDIIETPPTINELPPVDIKLEINSSIMDQFIKAKNALSDSEVLAFVQNGEEVNLVINYAEHNTDKITLKMLVNDISGNIPPMKFNSNIIKEVLSSNKDCLSGSIQLSSQGLLTMTFNGDGFNTKYLLVMLQN